MSMEQIIATVRGFEGALVVAPEPDGDFPEIAWGDAFFYYAPDGRIPRTTQPYGTIVTKDYPDDSASDLDPRAAGGSTSMSAGRRFRNSSRGGTTSLRPTWCCRTLSTAPSAGSAS